ncbi:alpha-galactosidase [Agrobacterium tumefaciens]|nr:alpha-galactosidase [Agrobacterium tumefaciens]NTE22914.1 alpha-galactosidase [Agrobacterium tumefaciens]
MLTVFSAASAQTNKPFFISIESLHNALILRVNAEQKLSMSYLGRKLANNKEYGLVEDAYKQSTDYSEELNAAYSSSGSQNLVEPAISLMHADGNNSTDLRYVKHQFNTIDSNVRLLSVYLKDPVYNFYVTLFYKIYTKEDVIEQWSSITNGEKGKITLYKYASANLHLKGQDFWLTQYHGDWAREMQPEESKLSHGIKTIDSKLGTRANLFQPSMFMVSVNKPATEDEGSVLFGAVEWSSNFRVDLEIDHQDNLRLIAGMNNFASPYPLEPKESFTTPVFLYTFSDQGKGEASRRLQRWARNYKILNGGGDRLTLLNNWEATLFDFNESKIKDLIKDAQKLGVDLFLLDDGWFANKYPRNTDSAGLGDWQENVKKLPNGIAALIKEATKDSVKFGIWIEPEMVNPKSQLYQEHPDWVIRQPQRSEHYFRNQLVLDLANPKVQDFVFGVVDSLFIKNPKLAYIKWDCNAVIFNAYSSYLKDQSKFYVEYGRGLYKVLERIRAKYPNVPMMLCSGGGGRIDYGALPYFTEFWPSDNTDPLERIFIQWEYSYFYPAIVTSNHVTDWGKQPIKYRLDVAMMGRLGFDIVVSKLSPNELQFCQEAIKAYNTIKPVIFQGDQYRLSNPHESSVASVMYVNTNKSSAVMFNYLVNNRYDQGSKLPIKLKGLDGRKRYRLKEINIYPGTATAINSGQLYSGEFLMQIGYNPNVGLKNTSVVIQINEEL